MIRLACQRALIDLEVIALDEYAISRQQVSYRSAGSQKQKLWVQGPFLPTTASQLSQGRTL